MYEFERGFDKNKNSKDGIFTSPELLYECRNILNRQPNTNLSSMLKKGQQY
jgi:hypothetical protein